MTTVNVRYMVDDVEASIAFYTSYLGFTLISKTPPRLPTSRVGISDYCSVARRARLAVRCRMVAGRSRVDGIAST